MINVPELFRLFHKNVKTVSAQEVERREDDSWAVCQVYVYDDQDQDQDVEGAVHSCVESLAKLMPKYVDYSMPPRLQPRVGAQFRCFDDAIVPFRVVIVYSLGLPTGEYYDELDEFGDRIPILKSGHMVTADAFVGEIK